MVERHSRQPAIAAHNADECGNGAGRPATVLKRSDFRARIEVLPLNAYLGHPPVTGGKNAISSPGRTTALESVCCWLTATRISAGLLLRNPARDRGEIGPASPLL